MKRRLSNFILLLVILATSPSTLADVDVVALDKDKSSSKYQTIQALAKNHSGNKKIALALGLNALKKIDRNLNDYDNVIVLFVTEKNFSLYKSQNNHKNLTAIYIEPSLQQSINLARVIFGDTRRFVIPTYGTNEPPGRIKIQSLDIKIIDTKKNKRWLSQIKNRDVVIAVPDQNIYTRNSINSIARSLIRRRAPLIGFSKSMTENVAAPASLHIKDEAIFSRIKEILIMTEQGKVNPAGYYVSNYDIAINKTLLKTLGIYDVNEIELLNKFNDLKAEK